MSEPGVGTFMKAAVRRWWLILLLVAVGGGGGYLTASQTPKEYRATTTLVVGSLQQSPDFSKDDVDASIALAQTYGTLIRGPAVLDGVIRDLELNTTWEQLQDRVSVDLNAGGTSVIEITTYARSAGEATMIARAVARRTVLLGPTGPLASQPQQTATFVSRRLDQLRQSIVQAVVQVRSLQDQLRSTTSDAERAQLLARIEDEQRLINDWQSSYSSLLDFISTARVPNTIDVLVPAEASSSPVRPDTKADVALGAAIGLIIALGIAYLLANRSRGSAAEVRRRRVAEPSPGVQPEPEVPDTWAAEVAQGAQRSQGAARGGARAWLGLWS